MLALGAGVFLLHGQNEDLRALIIQSSIVQDRRADQLSNRLAEIESGIDSIGGEAARLRSAVANAGSGTQKAMLLLSAVQGSITDMAQREKVAPPPDGPAQPAAIVLRQLEQPAPREEPSSAGALKEARELYASSRYLEAAQRLAPFASDPSPTRDARLLYAASLFHSRPDDTSTYSRIERDLRLVLKEDPQSFVALETLGSLCLEKGSWQEALEWLSEAVLLQPYNAELLQKAGDCALCARGYARAREFLDRAAELSPRNADVWYSAARAHAADGDAAGAVDRFNRCLDLNPGHRGAMREAGSCLQQLGRHAEAEAQWQRALIRNTRPED
jgi:tetratricopeptide (TPR) repeat protein